MYGNGSYMEIWQIYGIYILIQLYNRQNGRRAQSPRILIGENSTQFDVFLTMLQNTQIHRIDQFYIVDEQFLFNEI